MAWECPKCGYVYGPMVDECKNCNRPEYTTFNSGTSITEMETVDEDVEIQKAVNEEFWDLI